MLFCGMYTTKIMVRNDLDGEPFKGIGAHEQEQVMCLYIRLRVGGVLVKMILTDTEAVVELINPKFEQVPGHVDS